MQISNQINQASVENLTDSSTGSERIQNNMGHLKIPENKEVIRNK